MNYNWYPSLSEKEKAEYALKMNFEKIKELKELCEEILDANKTLSKLEGTEPQSVRIKLDGTDGGTYPVPSSVQDNFKFSAVAIFKTSIVQLYAKANTVMDELRRVQ